jgi:hypothetical protein
MNIAEDIDAVFSKAVVELSEKHAALVGDPHFSGQVTGVLLATAIKLAKDGGCPRSVLEQSVAARILEEYGP